LVALYSYPGAILLVPLLLLALAQPYWPRVRHLPRNWLLAAAAVAVLSALPLGAQFLDGRARTRLGQVSLLGNESVVALAQQRTARDRRDGLTVILESPAAIALRQGLANYLSHFGVTYLFTQGDAEWRHHSSDVAQLYLWDAPLLIAGIGALARHWRRSSARAIAGWLVIGPLPAALAENAPHAVRSIAMLPALYLLAATSVVPLWRWLRRYHLHLDWLLLLAASVAFYLYAYYRYYPYEHGRVWSSGVLEGFDAAQDAVTSGTYRRVVVAEQTGLSYIHLLFATRYDPQTYLAAGGTNPDAPALVFPPYEVRPVRWDSEPRAPDVLYALGGGTTLPAGARLVRAIQDVSGRDAVLLVDFPGAA
jgi:hypothetical protein